MSSRFIRNSNPRMARSFSPHEFSSRIDVLSPIIFSFSSPSRDCTVWKQNQAQNQKVWSGRTFRRSTWGHATSFSRPIRREAYASGFVAKGDSEELLKVVSAADERCSVWDPCTRNQTRAPHGRLRPTHECFVNDTTSPSLVRRSEGDAMTGEGGLRLQEPGTFANLVITPDAVDGFSVEPVRGPVDGDHGLVRD
jgi:hypothetical protein